MGELIPMAYIFEQVVLALCVYEAYVSDQTSAMYMTTIGCLGTVQYGHLRDDNHV